MQWPFAKRGTRVDAVTESALPLALPADLAAFSVNDACIKLWLPEKLVVALDALSATHEMSRPDVLRWLLFEHAYGRPALERLKAWKRKRDAEEARRQEALPAVGRAQFSPKQPTLSERQITTRLLGKSVEDCKLWLPLPLKSELEALAKAEALGISDYVRKTLVRMLLGETFHHQWQAAIGKLPEEARQFEQEQIV
ncbi:MAG: hypothetical protein NT123_24800 [Proteobacteria bacterium]|nr:hypothetical protein [Pseudomonadota bacterium]